MKENFNHAFELVIGLEGGYSNDPGDPGGETHWGISKRAFPTIDIKNLTLEQAKQIYLIEYWMKIGAEELPSGLDILAFDAAVNLGVYAAKGLLNKSNGDPYKFLIERVGYYVDLANRKDFVRQFFRGWINRVITLQRKVL